jgi:Ca-activated chloride channel family protein
MLMGALALAGCYDSSKQGAAGGRPGRARGMTMLLAAPASDAAAGEFPHGGTAHPNDQPASAMFFKNYGVNPFVDTDEDNLSTFAADVDTGSYTLCRSYLQNGNLPPEKAIRVEEFVNYFNYHYTPPKDAAFAVHTALAPSKFGDGKLLMRAALKGRVVDAKDRKNAVLTFVIDVSGSMDSGNRLGTVKKALRMLVDQLRPADRVGIAIYGSRGQTLLTHRSIEGRSRILDAIDELEPGGSTNAEEGLTIGYQMAQAAFQDGAINRVILCSDGVANVGRTGPKSILQIIEQHVKRGITLTTVGFGMGNYNDVLMEQLGDKGNGHYAYVDSLDEAKRVFVENLTGTLQVVARDVKVQVEFNKDVVRSYRLLGYENRDVADEDFRNDVVDGGEVGAGHSATALYELKLWPEKAGKLATVRVRFRDPDSGEVSEVAKSVSTEDSAGSFEKAAPSFRLAACVAEFAEVLRGSYWARGSTLAEVEKLAERCATEFDRRKDVAELASLVAKAHKLNADERVNKAKPKPATPAEPTPEPVE